MVTPKIHLVGDCLPPAKLFDMVQKGLGQLEGVSGISVEICSNAANPYPLFKIPELRSSEENKNGSGFSFSFAWEGKVFLRFSPKTISGDRVRYRFLRPTQRLDYIEITEATLENLFCFYLCFDLISLMEKERDRILEMSAMIKQRIPPTQL
ncbi:MAG: hypothetical protein HYS44_02895 [Candidatus Niyogibacteria bacterium]|nr:hypothetical protein [Candidatus Niyogibacteria bacterium]